MQKRKLLRVEQEEAKRIEIEVNLAERRRAMEVCAKLGFTLENVEGVKAIKPRALGMKGQEVDFDILEIGDRPSELKIKDEEKARELTEKKPKGNRVDLGKAADESKTRLLTSDRENPARMEGDFVSLDFGGAAADGQEFESLNYNHKLRRKLHRAIEAAQIQKELLVRAKTKEHCEKNGIEVPPELADEYKPIKLSGRRILEDGTVETEKQERVRKRLELAEYNKAAKVLRQQAKAEAIEAGLRVFAELTGKKPSDANEPNSQYENHTKLTSVANNTDKGDTTTTQESKKRARERDDLDTKKAKQSKKRKIHSGVNETESASAPEVDDDAAHKEKKRLEKELKQREAVNGDSTELMQDHRTTADFTTKTSKKGKRCDKENPVSLANGEKESSKHRSKKSKKRDQEAIQIADQWNPDALNGGAARKDKFLRLLGAGKVNGVEKAAKKVKREHVDLKQIENELERQFDTGVRMKHDGKGKRRGLGA